METKNSIQHISTNPAKHQNKKVIIAVAITLVALIVAGVLLTTVIIPMLKFGFQRLSDGSYAIVDVNGSPTKVVIPKKFMGTPVTKLEADAFSGCTSVTSIEIPDTIRTISPGYFDSRMPIEKAKIPASAISYIPKEKLVTLQITSGYVDSFAFRGCTSLKSVVIADGPCSLGGTEVFSGCTNLTTVTIGNDTDSLGEKAFYGCTSLKSVSIGTSLIVMHDFAFCGCTSLKSITIPDSVTVMGRFVFSGCSRLTSVVIPESVTYIGYGAFSGCTNLTIYCEATSKPSDWDSNWNYTNCPVFWYSESQPTTTGNYWHYVNGVVTKW